MSSTDKGFPLIAGHEEVRNALPHLDVRGALTRMFLALANGNAVQPPQTLTPFPHGAGDFITYLGAVADAKVFGAKLSPYIVTGSQPIITAWTALMSAETGQPLMWCDAALLTVERTAGATALAVDRLATSAACRLAIVGTGTLGQAHLRHLAPLRSWDSISVFSPDLAQNDARRAQLAALDRRVGCAAVLKTAYAMPTWWRCAHPRAHRCSRMACSPSPRSLRRSARTSPMRTKFRRRGSPRWRSIATTGEPHLPARAK
jgi:L-arginine dehydrogenase